MQQPQPTPTASAGRRSWPTWVNGRGAVWFLLPKCGAAGHGGTRRPLPGTAGHEQPRPTGLNGRDQLAQGAADGRYREGQGCWRLQGASCVD